MNATGSGREIGLPVPTRSISSQIAGWRQLTVGRHSLAIAGKAIRFPRRAAAVIIRINQLARQPHELLIFLFAERIDQTPLRLDHAGLNLFNKLSSGWGDFCQFRALVRRIVWSFQQASFGQPADDVSRVVPVNADSFRNRYLIINLTVRGNSQDAKLDRSQIVITAFFQKQRNMNLVKSADEVPWTICQIFEIGMV